MLGLLILKISSPNESTPSVEVRERWIETGMELEVEGGTHTNLGESQMGWGVGNERSLLKNLKSRGACVLFSVSVVGK